MGTLSVLETKSKPKIPKPKNDIENDPKYKEYANQSLEDLLDNLIKYGKHTISWMGDGWYCKLEMYVNVIGAELKVQSDFYNTTHKNAVIQCTIRLHETIDQINKTRN